MLDPISAGIIESMPGSSEQYDYNINKIIFGEKERILIKQQKTQYTQYIIIN